SCPAAVCGGVGRDQSVLQTGTTRSREVATRVGVTSDEAENAPRLRVANGDDSQESEPPVKRRAATHTASAQDSEPRFLGDGVPEPGIGGCKEPPGSQGVQRTEGISLPGSPRRARSPTTAIELSDCVFFLVLPRSWPAPLCCADSDSLFRSFIPAPVLRPPLQRPPMSSR